MFRISPATDCFNARTCAAALSGVTYGHLASMPWKSAICSLARTSLLTTARCRPDRFFDMAFLVGSPCHRSLSYANSRAGNPVGFLPVLGKAFGKACLRLLDPSGGPVDHFL